MNKSQLVEIIAEKTSLKIPQAEELVDLFFDAIIHALRKNQRVEIRGFGAFSTKGYKSYTGRNPKTGEAIAVEEKKLPVWRTGLELKKRVSLAGPEKDPKKTKVAGY